MQRQVDMSYPRYQLIIWVGFRVYALKRLVFVLNGFKYYLLVVAAVLLLIVGAVWGGAMTVFLDTGGSWLGSIGTVLTLVFLIVQNRSQAKEIKEEREKREHHETEQQKMWAQQREMLLFQKLQMHKSLFNDLLDELEDSLKVTFFDRTGMYKKFFPHNGFNQFSAVIHAQDIEDIQAGSLQDCKVLHHRVISELRNHKFIQSKDFFHNHLHDLLRFGSLLHLKLPNESQFGSITYMYGSEDILVTNIFEPHKVISTYEKVLQRLCDFAELKHSSSETHWGGLYQQALFDFVFLQISYREFTVHLGEIRGVISNIYTSFVKKLDDSWDDNNSFREELFHIRLLFTTELKNTTEAEAIKKLLRCTKGLYQALEESSDQSQPLSTSKQFQTLNSLNSSIKRLSDRLDKLQKRIRL
ncbi:hypothetical protein WOC12_00525 [Vibrio parahaemolyticus]|uniref:hypothetical protein n=1 Tax=Vibrio parahaemolyticus TaxID=670 RepID=UPI001130CD11|nr:hypothetical protein [Vibrio parahaemolyticus]MDF4737503.1 hypothetical protein [Vibrio parahaemolyticus]